MIRHELIGKKAIVTIHNNSFAGTIIDETKNTLIIETSVGRKTIIKNNSKIQIEDRTIEGKDLIKRPEERIKRK